MMKKHTSGQVKKPPVKGAAKPTPNKSVKPLTPKQAKSGTT